MNPPDELSAAALAAAEQTFRHSRFDPDTLHKQLAQAAQLLRSLPRPPESPSLVFRRPGTDAVECVAIGSGVSAGRGESCEIRFEDRRELSRRHFAVRPGAEGFFVEDLGSSNGTMVAGVAGKVQRRELRDGDIVLANGIDFLFIRPE